jgi:hypothetical protein
MLLAYVCKRSLNEVRIDFQAPMSLLSAPPSFVFHVDSFKRPLYPGDDPIGLDERKILLKTGMEEKKAA